MPQEPAAGQAPASLDSDQGHARVRPKIIALDDWLIYAENQAGEVVFSSSECWPQWLCMDQSPEDMDDETFKRISLQIVHQAAAWADYKTWYIEGELDFAAARGMVVTDAMRAEAVMEADRAIAEIRELGLRQADFIAANSSAGVPADSPLSGGYARERSRA